MKVQLVLPDQLDLKVEQQEQLVLVVPLDQLVHRVHKDHPVQLGNKAFKV